MKTEQAIPVTIAATYSLPSIEQIRSRETSSWASWIRSLEKVQLCWYEFDSGSLHIAVKNHNKLASLNIGNEKAFLKRYLRDIEAKSFHQPFNFPCYFLTLFSLRRAWEGLFSCSREVGSWPRVLETLGRFNELFYSCKHLWLMQNKYNVLPNTRRIVSSDESAPYDELLLKSD